MKKFIKYGLLGFVGLILIVAVAGGGSSDDSSSTASNGESQVTRQEDAPASTASIGDPVRDGKFEFVIDAVECGLDEIVTSAEFNLSETPQGEFCVMDLTVSNIGDEAQSFSYDDQKVFNAEGLTFSPDTSTISLENNDAVFEQINPGNKIQVQVVYDVPVGETPTKAELHDSFLSDGVEVQL